MKIIVRFLAISILLLTGMSLLQAQPPGGGGWSATPAQMAERQTSRMKESLGLSEEQTAKVSEINLKYATKMHEARQNNQGDFAAMREVMQTMRQEQDEELKTVLNETQFQQWEKIRAEQRGPGMGPRQGQGAPEQKPAKEKKKDKSKDKKKKGNSTEG